jgi:hypothetical protein
MSELSSLNTSVLFTNWTKEDFTHSWGGRPFTFKARSSEWISVGDKEHNEGLARHFAKHLTDRELNKRGVPTDHFTRHEFEKNCFTPTEETADVPVLEVEIHKETGLVQAVVEVGREDVVKGTKTPAKVKKRMDIEEETVVEEPKVEVKETKKAQKKAKDDEFEE